MDTLDEVKLILKELALERKKTEEMAQKTEAMAQKTEAMAYRTDALFQETDQMFKETSKMIRDMRLSFKDTDKKIKELSGLFTTQWGKLIEALVKPGTLKLFQKKGITITQTSRENEAELNGRHMELDVILIDGDVAVVVEVKTTMKVEAVNEFLEDLDEVKVFFSQLRDKKVYGAVAALSYAEESDRYAYRKGLYVIKVTGDDILEIVNDDGFQPRAW